MFLFLGVKIVAILVKRVKFHIETEKITRLQVQNIIVIIVIIITHIQAHVNF